MTIIAKALARCAVGVLLAVAAAVPAHALLLADPMPSSPYVEMGDAPGLPDWQVVTGGPYDGFTGMIGDPDFADAFAFSILTGGTYLFEGAFTPQVMDDQGNIGVIVLSLWTLGGMSIVNDTFFSFEVDLTPGSYVLEVTTAFELDPPYTIEVDGPVALPLFELTVSEPATLAVLGLGLIGLGFARKRRGT